MNNVQRIFLAGLAILVVVFGATTFYFYNRYSEIKANPQATAEETTQDLVEEVSKLMILPEGETPTVATVVDPEKLKDQVFFARAKAGDKVLIYPNARKAILYDPVNKKVVEVAPVNIGEQTPAPTPTPTPTPQPKPTSP